MEQFYRLSIEAEEFLDNDKYNSVMEAFKDIPERIEELLIDEYQFKSSRPFLIEYLIVDDENNILSEKNILKVDATKLLLKIK